VLMVYNRANIYAIHGYNIILKIAVRPKARAGKHEGHQDKRRGTGQIG